MDFNPEVLYRYFKGSYSQKDYQNIKTFFEDESFHPVLKEHLEEHWANYFNEPLPSNNLDHLLNSIHSKIQSEQQPSKKTKFIVMFQRVAAILIVPMLLSFLVVIYLQINKRVDSSAYAEIQCPLGVRTKFELPDGSTGFLNSGSKLKFPAVFSNERNVMLSGEAFFKVIHNESSPFIVHTSNLQIKVLGTQFNMSAYEQDSNEEVTLNTGKLAVLSPEGNLYGTLTPNQSLIFNKKNQTIQKKNVEASQYIGWTEGKLIFRYENMKQVAERLSRWYNADIDIEDPEVLDYALRATFMDEPLDEVLKLLTLTAPITFKEQPRETTKDNIYKRRKIILMIDKEKQAAFK